MSTESVTLKRLEDAVEQYTGETAEALRRETAADRRTRIEDKTGKKLRLTNNFPFLGRGNIMRDRVLSAEEIDRTLLKALHHE